MIDTGTSDQPDSILEDTISLMTGNCSGKLAHHAHDSCTEVPSELSLKRPTADDTGSYAGYCIGPGRSPCVSVSDLPPCIVFAELVWS